MEKFDLNELNNKTISELEIIRNKVYNDFVESLAKAPQEVRESFNYYVNLARTIEIIINERNKEEPNNNKLKK